LVVTDVLVVCRPVVLVVFTAPEFNALNWRDNFPVPVVLLFLQEAKTVIASKIKETLLRILLIEFFLFMILSF
jgi:hypothetical protein